MWSGGDYQFRRGLGLALIGLAFLLGALFFGQLAVMAELTSRGGGAANSLIGLVLAMTGGIMCLLGGAMVASPPAYPPQYPPRM